MSDARSPIGDQLATAKSGSFDDEIDLRELFDVLWAGKGIIIAITAFAAALSLAYALSLPNIYQSKALLAPKGGSGGGGLAAMASQFGGLASLAGINLPGGGDTSKSLIAQER